MHPFDLTDVDATDARERELRAQVTNLQTLRSRAFAQGFVECLDQGATAEEWRELYAGKAR